MTSVYRVTVRGRFADLTDAQRSWLKTNQGEHDVFVSSFTDEGSLSYEPAIDFFSFRREVRLEPPAGETEAAETAIRSAEQFLKILRIAHSPLKAAVMDMSAMVQRHGRE
jgi:hypothetical protein